MVCYAKRPLTFDQQVDLLESRGVVFSDRNRAVRHLTNINYYRLSAYMLPFKPNKYYRGKSAVEVLRLEKLEEEQRELFANDTQWDDIYNHYIFDRKLRLLIFDAIERIEVAVRTQVCNQLCLKYGIYWHDNAELFRVTKRKNNQTGEWFNISAYDTIRKRQHELLNSKNSEDFIAHHKDKYGSDSLPSWKLIETIYLGDLIAICRGLNHNEDIKDVARYFGFINEDVFCSWLLTINYVRNICAHHSRLWNRTYNIKPKLLKKACDRLLWTNHTSTLDADSQTYYFICVLRYFLQTVNPTSNFKNRLVELLRTFPGVNISDMGFPDDWHEDCIWK